MKYLSSISSDNCDVTFVNGTFTGDLTVDTNTLYVDSTNNRVGIGTTSPSVELEVGGSTNTQVLISATNTTGNSQLYFGDSVSDTAGVILYRHDGDSMAFEVNDSERMRIISDGSVGINTTSPGYTLDVNGSLHSTNINIADGIYHEGDTNTYMQFHASDQWRVVTGGVERLEVNNSSTTVQNVLIANDFVGIGTNSPSANLHIAGGVTILGQNKIDGSSDNLKIMSDYAGVSGSSTIEFSVDNSEKMRITNGGNVLIGTTTDNGQKLQVNGSVLASDYIGSTHIYLSSPDSWIFRSTGGTERMRLTSAGSLGIGTTSPSEKLDVAGNIQASGSRFIRAEYDSNHYMQLESNSSGGILKGLDGGTTTVLVRSYGDSYFNGGSFGIGQSSPTARLEVIGTIKQKTGSGYANYVQQSVSEAQITFSTYSNNQTNHPSAIKFSPNGTEAVRIDNDGNLGVGTSSPSSLLQVQSGVGNTQLDGHQILLSRAGNNHIFATSASGVLALGTNNAEKMRITSGGNVSIGTTQNFGRLMVSGASTTPSLSSLNGTDISLILSNSDTGYGTMFATFGSGIGALQQRRTNSATYYSFSLQPHGGNVLIGTTTDSGYKLDVSGAAQVSHTSNEIVNLNTTHANGGYTAYKASGTAKGFVGFGSTLFTGLDINNFGIRSQGGLALASGGGNVRLYINSSGSVGIGTTSPATFLHSNNGSVSPNSFRIENSDGYGQITTDSNVLTYDAEQHLFNNRARSSEYMRINASGNVLIGTTTDSGYKLDVNGTVSTSRHTITESATAQLRINSTGSGSKEIIFQNNGTTSGYVWQSGSTVAMGGGSTSNSLYVNTSSGNVGIGTSSPAYKLDVTGELRATSVLRANSNAIVGGYIDLTGDFFHRDDIKVLNKAANNWLIWAQRDTAASEVVVDLNYIGTITPGSDSAYDIGTNTVRFANGYFDTLYGDGSNLTGITETDTLATVTGRGATTTNSITVGGLTVDTSTLHVDASNNRVGVGTTSPSATFTVVGDQLFDGTGINLKRTGVLSGRTWNFGVDSNGLSVYDINSSSYRLTIDETGNVGIGTSSPSHKLHVNGGNIFGSSNVLATNNVYAAGPQGFVFGSSTSEGEYIYRSGNDIRIHANSADRLTVLGTGAVGIGTTAPSAKLDIVGDGADFFLQSNDFKIARIQPRGTAANLDRGLFSLFAGSAENVRIDTYGASWFNGGDIGVGTTSPETLLHLESTSTGLSPILTVENDNDIKLKLGAVRSLAGTAPDTTFIAYDSSLRFIADADSTTEVARISSSGNLLIGTTTDNTQKLQVNGTSRFDDTMYVSEYIAHLGDGNTAVRFLDDALQFNAGGVAMMKLTEGSADTVTINPDSADVNFQVNGDTVANLLFVDAGTSNVGIGTSSPDRQLQIHASDSGTSAAKFTNSTTGEDGDTGFFVGINASEECVLYGYNSTHMRIGTNGSERMRITSGGNILIGTTTDSGFYKVDIDGTTRITGDTSTNGTVRFSSDKGVNNSHIHYGTNGDWYIRSATASGKVVIQDSGAVVGIGTASPSSSYKLDVNGDTNVAGDYYVNGNQGWSGTISINANPPVSITVEGGIITNVT